jgi:hypothetical protein
VSTTADEVSSVRVGGRLERGTLVAACLSVALARLCLTLPVALNGIFSFVGGMYSISIA